MSQFDPKREFAVEVVCRLKGAGYTALWAGGCVRDLLLGREPKDYDVATSAKPDAVRRFFGHQRTFAVGASFGVIIVRGPKAVGNLEVATFRREGPYSDGRHPDRVTFSSPEEDAQRRDLTINGLFYDPIDERVLDYVGGEKDLHQKIVRAIGDPLDRMSEDKLRMLRAVRFAATLDFTLDQDTANAIRQMAHKIEVVSAERIADELRRMLIDPHRRRAMELTRDVGVLQLIIPELADCLKATDETEGELLSAAWPTTLHMLDQLQDPRFELAATALLHSVVWPKLRAFTGTQSIGQVDHSAVDRMRAICQRMRLPNDETDNMCWLVSRQRVLIDAPHLELAQLKRILAHPLSRELLSLSRAEAEASAMELSSVEFCEEYLRKTSAEELNPPTLITGDDLIALGLKSGPRFKKLLEIIRNAQLNGEISTRQQALEVVDQLIGGEDDQKQP